LREDDSNASIDVMGTITVRHLDEAVKQALRQRAATGGHSLEEEVRRTLKESVDRHPRPKTGAELYRRIREIVEPVGGIELDIPPRRPTRRPPALE
jgi:plasmid stability protein